MNLVFQYYMPYEANDAHLGGVEMPDWAKTGSESAKRYAKHCSAAVSYTHLTLPTTPYV